MLVRLLIIILIFSCRYLENHVKGCGNSRKEEEIIQDQKQELMVTSSNHANSNQGTVILISNEGQQAFMVANTNNTQTITLT